MLPSSPGDSGVDPSWKLGDRSRGVPRVVRQPCPMATAAPHGCLRTRITAYEGSSPFQRGQPSLFTRGRGNGHGNAETGTGTRLVFRFFGCRPAQTLWLAESAFRPEGVPQTQLASHPVDPAVIAVMPAPRETRGIRSRSLPLSGVLTRATHSGERPSCGAEDSESGIGPVERIVDHTSFGGAHRVGSPPSGASWCLCRFPWRECEREVRWYSESV
jgi:hypothetical protein